MTIQQQIISQYLWDYLAEEINNPFKSEEELAEYVEQKIRCIYQEESLAVDLTDEYRPIKKIDSFESVSTISKESRIIPYKTFAELFYETQCL